MVDIERLYNDLHQEYCNVVDELEKYKDKLIPKFNIGEKLFAVNIKDKNVVEISVDEIVLNRFGIAYRNYASETEMYQFPEQYCFQTVLDAHNSLAQNK